MKLNHLLLSTAIASAVVLGANMPVAADEQIRTGIVIRSINPAFHYCNKNTIFTNPDNISNDNTADNLSVNCTTETSKINDYTRYTATLGAGNFCVAKVADILRNGGFVQTNAIEGRNPNPLHCLINDIDTSKMGQISVPR